MIGRFIASLGVIGVLCTPIMAASAQSSDAQRVTIKSGPHWDIAYPHQISRALRCPRSGGQALLTLTIQDTGKATVFYAVSALAIDGKPVDEPTLAAINRGIAEYRTMPEVLLQCADKVRRIALIGEGRTAGRELIVPLGGTN